MKCGNRSHTRSSKYVVDIDAIGRGAYTADDVAQLHRKLRDDVPLGAVRHLINAAVEDGALIAFFETSIEPSLNECRELYRLTYGALTTLRRPLKFNSVKTYPGPEVEVGYLPI